MSVMAKRLSLPAKLDGWRAWFQPAPSCPAGSCGETPCGETPRFRCRFLAASGTDDSFIDKTMARQAYLFLVELAEPRTVNSLNGLPLSCTMYRNASLTLLILGNHPELIQLFLIQSSAFGGPRFFLACCPQPTNRLDLGHNQHLERCVSLALLALRPSSISPLDLTSPSVGVELSLSEPGRWAFSLLPQRSYNCAIDLRPDTPLPSARFYHLPTPKWETNKSYIEESQAPGLINPSSSPVGAGFFFVRK